MSLNSETPAPQDLPEIFRDLVVLADEGDVNLDVSFVRGEITIRSQGRTLWSSRLERPWAVVDGHARAACVVKWLHHAAEKRREQERARMAAMEEAA